MSPRGRPAPKPPKAAPAKRAVVESIRHKDSRVNIPTEELRDFVVEEERAPKTMLYPRDPSLDPQLVWKGKDEQDRKALAVPVVPIYIQEKIHPQALIDDVCRQGQKAAETKAPDEGQLDLFGDFNGLTDFDKKVDFYHHDQHWSNRLILGDSLLVMTSLAEKEGLKGKVQCIYFDPPYGIKFGSNWQVSTRKRDVKDGKVEDATRQPEQVKAFRDTWKGGVHSYLAYLRDRLVTAHELLTDTGSCFVQIGDENVHHVREIMDEVFGTDGFCAELVFRKTTGAGSPMGGTDVIAGVVDHIVWYAKSIEHVKYRQLYLERAGEGWVNYDYIRTPDGTHRKMTSDERLDWDGLPSGSEVYRRDNLTSTSSSGEASEAHEFDGKKYSPGPGGWKTSRVGMERLQLANRLEAYGSTLSYRRFARDFGWFRLSNLWDDTATGGYGERKVYVVQTITKVVERCVLMTTDPGDLVVDPTCGSGTTAFVAEHCGRRWVTIDTSRVALALARTRLMAAKFPYFLLSDSPEGIDKEAELTGHRPPPHQTDGDIRKGFVYQRVPHVTLKSIANNPDIKPGMTREQIDVAIARHAESELLYDKPYEDGKRVRVSGPFTVESLSPHRVLAADDNLDGTVTEQEGRRQQDFTTMILDNLRTAGVQNTKKGERMKFESLEPMASPWLQAQGAYTGADGKSYRVAVAIGPEHGTVGPQLVKEAAKEAVKGVGFDVLVVCGFAFDPHVSEEALRYGKLTVLPTRMNPDLAMGDDLLKKTGAGNLFTVFGEPDVEIRKEKDGWLSVEIRGVDVYDPTTGEVRTSSTDDIACWFIDTDYNGESFFVRHAYFTGAEEPYDKLKRALRAEVDEAAWSALYSTKSRVFPKPGSGKIAVKVINHYGDEVLKVFEVK